MLKSNKLINKFVNVKDRLLFFNSLSPKQQATLLLDLSNYYKKLVMQNISTDKLIDILEYMDPDTATDLIQKLPQKKQKTIIKNLNKKLKEDVVFLSKFNPNTVGGLMDLNYILVDKNTKIEDIHKLTLKHEKRTGKFPIILVAKENKLLGELPAYLLPILKKGDIVNKHIKKIALIKHSAKKKDLLKLIKKHKHKKIAVIGNNNQVLGILNSDDILEFLTKQTGKSLYKFAGVHPEEDIFDPINKKVENRYPWLIINLFTAFLATLVISFFEDTISNFIYLAAYMPVVTSMGGNAGTQTLAVTIRGLALNEINKTNAWEIIKNEGTAGLLNGALVGTIATAVALIFNYNVIFGIIIFLAMVINMVNAGIFGASIPLILKKMGKDPATSATIFITTATDILGFFIFLWLAKILL